MDIILLKLFQDQIENQGKLFFLVTKNSSNQLMENKSVKHLQEAQSHTEMVEFREQSVI